MPAVFWGSAGRRTTEHEGRNYSDGEGRCQGADVEPQAGSQRPVAEDERQHRERQRRWRQHRGQGDQRELGVDPSHVVA
jgi:hypothetical protein